MQLVSCLVLLNRTNLSTIFLFNQLYGIGPLALELLSRIFCIRVFCLVKISWIPVKSFTCDMVQNSWAGNLFLVRIILLFKAALRFLGKTLKRGSYIVVFANVMMFKNRRQFSGYCRNSGFFNFSPNFSGAPCFIWPEKKKSFIENGYPAFHISSGHRKYILLKTDFQRSFGAVTPFPSQ